MHFNGRNRVGFNWYNGSIHPTMALAHANNSFGSDSAYYTNEFQNYFVSVNVSNGNTYEYAGLNGTIYQSAYENDFTSYGSFGFFSFASSKAYETWHYIAIANTPLNKLKNISISINHCD
ncbi:hypothetical protein OXIME_000766 [Oxyplasma meridianum]|uniref:Uncharacterized protein n=1 Tax=Oxyplasma meridianum TaxID=3073602 RepID=A0AAX4NFH3_9ARCH